MINCPFYYSYYSDTNKPLVHHMTLFECSQSSYPGSDPMSWDIWVKSSGAVCNSNLLTPRDWDACITPVAVWSISSTGTNIKHCIKFISFSCDMKVNRTQIHFVYHLIVVFDTFSLHANKFTQMKSMNKNE